MFRPNRNVGYPFPTITKDFVQTGKTGNTSENNPDDRLKLVQKLMSMMAKYGLWTDLLTIWTGTEWQMDAMKLIAEQLKEDLRHVNEGQTISSVAKYAPTEGCRYDKMYPLNKIPPSSMVAYFLSDQSMEKHSDVMKLYRTQYLCPLRKILRDSDIL